VAFALFLGLSILFDEVVAHNYLTWPVSRGHQRQSQTGCRYGGEGNPTCGGPCDRVNGQSTQGAITVQRGQSVGVTWYRHTHPGGFVRFAWAQTAQSDSHSTFDNYVQQYVCKEIGGCGAAIGEAADQSSNGIDCGTNITVPLSLTDGTWTLQWAYFGGWLNAGDYYACVDYTVSGGPTGQKMSAAFYGGDATYPGTEQCLFYSTTALHACTVEPCTNGTYTVGAPQSGSPTVYTPPSTYTPVPIGISHVVSNNPSGSSSEEVTVVPCVNSTCTNGGVCDITGFCTKAKSKLSSGGVAAIVFAMLVLLMIVIAVIFFVINKSEVPFMKPFKGLPR